MDLQNETIEAAEERLSRELQCLSPEALPGFLAREKETMITSLRPFADYVRARLRARGVLQQEVFLAADLSDNYGYKLIAQEKRTRQRDTILRLCLAAGFSPEETRTALILYGMAPLYACFPRDAAVWMAANNGVRDLSEVNRLLERCGQPPLLKGYE